MTTAQTIFVIALSIAALIITGFAIFVFGTTIWADRWVRPGRRAGVEPSREQKDAS